MKSSRGDEWTAPADELHPARLLEFFKTSRLGRTVVLLERVTSTNSAAMDAALLDAREGTLVIAEEQSEGRGRKGRSWFSTSGRSLVFSIVLRPVRAFEGLTSLIALATVSALEDICGAMKDVGTGADSAGTGADGAGAGAGSTADGAGAGAEGKGAGAGSTGAGEGGAGDRSEDAGCEIMIKWPNDIYLNGKKIGGVLSEAKEGSVVIGMGLDINESGEDFPAEIAGLAISLRMATGKCMDRGAVLAAIINMFETMYMLWEDRGLIYFKEDLEDRILYLNEDVVLESGGTRFGGKILGITDDGYLRLEVEGEEKVFSSGDLTLVREVG